METKDKESDVIRFPATNPKNLGLGAKSLLFYSDNEGARPTDDFADDVGLPSTKITQAIYPAQDPTKLPFYLIHDPVLMDEGDLSVAWQAKSGELGIPEPAGLKGKFGVVYIAYGSSDFNKPDGHPPDPGSNVSDPVDGIAYVIVSDTDTPPPPPPKINCPEIDPGCLPSALTLLIGGIIVLRGRRRQA
jgi:hypothetical protein